VPPVSLIDEADRCVKCGLCLPHCPTYRATRDEGDSPRGRIALIQALASGELSGHRLQRHLDRCLDCRLCESACPSGVRYGDLIDGARREQPPGGIRRRLLWWGISTLPYWPATAATLHLYQRSGLQRLVSRLGGARMRRLNQLLQPLPVPVRWQQIYPAVGKPRGRIGLFTGCVGRITEQQALQATIRLLNRLGIEVRIPPDQGCCGALHQHNGYPQQARRLGDNNRKAFSHRQLDAILYLASGCSDQLTATPGLDVPVMAVSDYLQRLDWPFQLQPLTERVLLHIPCSMRTTDAIDNVTGLLRRIPDIDLATLPADSCCGAAGSYLLTQPVMADRLRNQLLQPLQQIDGPAILVTSNTGCAMHLAAGSQLQLMHPVQLIERQLHC